PRQPLDRSELHGRNEVTQHRPDRACAQKPRFIAAPGVQYAVSEDMSPFGMSRELDLINANEVHFEVGRHGFGRAYPEACRSWDLTFFASDERNLVAADRGPHAVIDFAREQPQWQAEHACVVFQHAPDTTVGLASVC